MIARVRTRECFVRLRRDGLRVRAGPLWCTYLRDPESRTPQVAFAIGRATGNAVARNLLRRRLRAILADSDVPPGLLLIGTERHATELTFAQLTVAVGKLVNTIKALR